MADQVHTIDNIASIKEKEGNQTDYETDIDNLDIGPSMVDKNAINSFSKVNTIKKV